MELFNNSITVLSVLLAILSVCIFIYQLVKTRALSINTASLGELETAQKALEEGYLQTLGQEYISVSGAPKQYKIPEKTLKQKNIPLYQYKMTTVHPGSAVKNRIKYSHGSFILISKSIRCRDCGKRIKPTTTEQLAYIYFNKKPQCAACKAHQNTRLMESREQLQHS